MAMPLGDPAVTLVKSLKESSVKSLNEVIVSAFADTASSEAAAVIRQDSFLIFIKIYWY